MDFALTPRKWQSGIACRAFAQEELKLVENFTETD
jgi:hypothetical protein